MSDLKGKSSDAIKNELDAVDSLAYNVTRSSK